MAEKICKCVVEHNAEFLSVRGEKETIRIEGASVPGSWSFFNSEETKLFDKLEEYTSGSTITLTAKEMHTFLKARNRAQEAWENSKHDEANAEVAQTAGNQDDLRKVDVPDAPSYAKSPPEINGTAKQAVRNTIVITERRATRLITSSSGQDEVERQLNSLQASVDLAKEGYHMVIYDIPQNLSKQCPNPSWIFWKFAFRLNLSCWVFTTKGLNSSTIQEVFSHWHDYPDVHVHVIQYHDNAIAQIKEIAQQKLDEMIREVHTSMITTIDSADDQFKALEAVAAKEGIVWSAYERDRKESYRESRIRAAIKSAGHKLNCAIECAERFDQGMNVRQVLHGLRAAIASQTESLKSVVEFRKGI